MTWPIPIYAYYCRCDTVWFTSIIIPFVMEHITQIHTKNVRYICQTTIQQVAQGMEELWLTVLDARTELCSITTAVTLQLSWKSSWN